MKNWYAYIILLGVLLACTKDGKNITVKGRVYNPVTGAGIPNCEIRLLKTTSGSPGTSGGYEDVATVYTDNDGYYELNHTSMFVRYVGCYPDQNEYEEIGWVKDGIQTGNTSFEKVNLGKYTYLDCEVVTYGLLNSHVQNVNCEGASDEMIVRKKYQFTGWDSYWSPVKQGCYNQSSTEPVILPIGLYVFETKVTRPSGVTYVYDTVFVSEAGISNLEILY